MIEFRDLHKSFDSLQVLRGVDLTVEEGETLALLGPSGTGKSVLIKHAIGLLEPDQGDVIVDGISIANASARELKAVRQRIGYVFQNAALFDSLTVAENLWLAQTDEKEGRRIEDCRAGAEDLLHG
jgi:phospholipid/cholesterol/gamma-HCH transport system ATP-binding protein